MPVPFVLAASVPKVAQAVTSEIGKLGSGIVGLLDPGKARDKAREARAESWFQAALAGSVTAARHVYGGQTLVYTVKEKGYYADRWNRLLQQNPTVAAQAQAAGPLGIPDDPSTQEQTAVQQEIQAWANKVRGATADLVADVAAGAGSAANQAIAPNGQGKTLIPINAGTLAAIGVAVLLLVLLIRRR